VPVNPNETEVEGVAAVSTLAEAVTVGARALWLQLGVINLESARIAAAGGLAVVMNRCTAIEIRRIGQR
jgi:predicted CoA-binding protein